MKKIITIILAAGSLCLFSQSASAQSLKDLFGSGSLKDVVESVTGIDLTGEVDVTGTWNYTGTAVELESSDILKKAGAKLAVDTIEKKLDETVEKIGITPGLFSFTFNADKSFTATFKKKELEGTYTLSEDQKTLTLTFGRFTKLGTMEVDVDVDEKEMSLLFEADNLLSLLGKITAKSSSSAMKTMATLVEAYEGMNLGLELTKN